MRIIIAIFTSGVEKLNLLNVLGYGFELRMGLELSGYYSGTTKLNIFLEKAYRAKFGNNLLAKN